MSTIDMSKIDGDIYITKTGLVYNFEKDVRVITLEFHPPHLERPYKKTYFDAKMSEDSITTKTASTNLKAMKEAGTKITVLSDEIKRKFVREDGCQIFYSDF